MALLFTEAGSNVTLSAGGTVATKTGDSGFRNSVAVLGESMADGVHCWELEITKRRLNNLLVGVCKADVNVASTLDLYAGNKAWFIDCDRGDLYGNGAHGSDAAGGFTSGDRLGCRLDLGAGTLVYFKNGAPHGSGHTGVLGPVKRCIEMSTQKGTCVTVLEGAVIAVPAAEAPLGGASAPTSFRWRPRRQRAPRRPQRRLRQASAGAMAAARRTRRRRWMPRRLRRGRQRWTTAALKMSAELKTKAEAKKAKRGCPICKCATFM